jgi:hypothetical protein
MLMSDSTRCEPWVISDLPWLNSPGNATADPVILLCWYLDIRLPLILSTLAELSESG